MHSVAILDHFQNPRNVGEIPDPDASAQLENPACGDVLRLTLQIRDGRVSEIRFLAQGCVATVACASALTELVSQQTLIAARQVRRETLVEALGGLSPESGHASHLAMDTLRAALGQLPL